MKKDVSRRAFLQHASTLSIAGTAAPFVINLASIGEASATNASDYKAIVCIFLYGGNDYANTLIPADQANYNDYYIQRPRLAYSKASLANTLLYPTFSGGLQFALAPELSPLLPIWNSGKLATILNLGTLVQPTSKSSYQKNRNLPPKLLSHNDQQSYWQSSSPEGASTGWGGRIGDLLMAGNNNAALSCVNVSGNAVFLTGQAAIQYSVTPFGGIPLKARSQLQGSRQAGALLTSLIQTPVNHILETQLTKVNARALNLYDAFSTAIANAPSIKTIFPPATDPQSSLGSQLKEVAKMISVSSQLGLKRQVFFVSTSRFDTHDGLATLHPILLQNLAEAMRAFYDTTVELGISNNVTTFTASDFGRALTANNDGSDHGWGGHHFVMGGAVKGGRFYGSPPALANNGPDDIGQGRLIPTTSVDQYAATIASWMGVTQSDMSTILPNIGNFSTKNLGFV